MAARQNTPTKNDARLASSANNATGWGEVKNIKAKAEVEIAPTSIKNTAIAARTMRIQSRFNNALARRISLWTAVHDGKQHRNFGVSGWSGTAVRSRSVQTVSLPLPSTKSRRRLYSLANPESSTRTRYRLIHSSHLMPS